MQEATRSSRWVLRLDRNGLSEGFTHIPICRSHALQVFYNLLAQGLDTLLVRLGRSKVLHNRASFVNGLNQCLQRIFNQSLSTCHDSGMRTYRICVVEIFDEVACCYHGSTYFRWDQQINYSSEMYSIHLCQFLFHLFQFRSQVVRLVHEDLLVEVLQRRLAVRGDEVV